MNDTFTMTIIANNLPGVSTRITSLFSQRGFNIDTFTSGKTEDEKYARITFTASGDSRKKEQMINQISKLYDVKKVEIMNPDETIIRELMIIKIAAKGDRLREVIDISSVFKCKIVDMTPGIICIEITGETKKIDSFIANFEKSEILELCRTGVIAVSRGRECLMEGLKK